MKNFAKSLTIWGAALVGGLEIAEVSGAVPIGSSKALVALGQAFGLVMVVIGRWRASEPLTAGPSS